jgi:hypothetical protein
MRELVLKIMFHRTRNPDCDALLFELKVHLSEHPTGKTHPRAVKPSITLYRVPEGTKIDDDAEIAMAMEVFGENLVITNEVNSLPSDDNFVFLYIYNWETGDAKCVSRSAILHDLHC